MDEIVPPVAGTPWYNLTPTRASVLLALLSVAMLLWTFRVGIDLSMADSLSKASSAWPRYAIGAAISRLAYGAPGYLVYAPVMQAFEQTSVVTDANGTRTDLSRGIQGAIGHNFSRDCGPANPNNCLPDRADEKGYADYMIAAFTIFGYSIQSLYNLYFLILGISVLTFFVQFFREPGYLILAPLFLAGHHLAVLLLPDNQVTSVIHDGHFLPAVACLAALHIAILLVRKEGSWLWSLPSLVVQTAIILFIIDSRSSAKWMIYFPLIAFAFALVWNRRLSDVVPAIVRRGHIIALLLVAPLLLGLYKDTAYDRRYTEDGMPTHVVWHALYMGLSVHPEASSRFGFRYSDLTSYIDAHTYLMKHPELIADRNIDPRDIPFEPVFGGNWVPHIGWQAYERIVRSMFFSFLAEHPRFAAETYLIYKPRYLVEQVLWQIGLIDAWPSWVSIEPEHMPLKREILGVVSVPAVLVVVAALAVTLASGGARQAGTWAGLTSLLFLTSLAPSILVAPIYYELPVVFVTLTTCVYALGATLAAVAYQILVRPRDERVSAPVSETQPIP